MSGFGKHPYNAPLDSATAQAFDLLRGRAQDLPVLRTPGMSDEDGVDQLTSFGELPTRERTGLKVLVETLPDLPQGLGLAHAIATLPPLKQAIEYPPSTGA